MPDRLTDMTSERCDELRKCRAELSKENAKGLRDCTCHLASYPSCWFCFTAVGKFCISEISTTPTQSLHQSCLIEIVNDFSSRRRRGKTCVTEDAEKVECVQIILARAPVLHARGEMNKKRFLRRLTRRCYKFSQCPCEFDAELSSEFNILRTFQIAQQEEHFSLLYRFQCKEAFPIFLVQCFFCSAHNHP